MNSKEIEMIEELFCDGSPIDFDKCTEDQLRRMHDGVNKLVDYIHEPHSRDGQPQQKDYCTSCQGTGDFLIGDTCEDCKGTGQPQQKERKIIGVTEDGMNYIYEDDQPQQKELPSIMNLEMWILGKAFLTPYQRALAVSEFHNLLDYAKNQPQQKEDEPKN
jgi:hypothetical protein